MILLAVLLPIIFGLLIIPLKLKNRNVKLTLMMVVLAATAAICVAMAIGGETVCHIWQMTQSLSLDLKVDDLSRLFIILVSGGWLLTGLYACIYMKHEKNEDRFFAFMLISEGAMLMVALAENLTTLFAALSYGAEKTVVCSFDVPSLYYDYFETADMYINAYSSDSSTMRAFVDGILGDFAFTGRSPVALRPEFVNRPT